MKRQSRTMFEQVTLAILIAAGLVTLSACRRNDDSGESALTAQKKAVVSEEGMRIVFPEDNPGLKRFKTVVATKGTTLIPVIAPARVVASISSAVPGGEKFVLFELPDVTSLYSQYRQSKSNVELTSKNLSRIRDMFENHAATAKDVNQAENDAAIARSSKAEFEGKLRAAGFNPAELDSVSSGTVWLISDVPETQLNEVQKGEAVDVVFSSFPDKKFVGRADAVGDVVDPTTRTVKVRVSLPNPKGKFLPGMFARVDFGDPLSGVIVLPLSAIVTVEEKDYVFVQEVPGTFRRREVTLVNASALEAVILKGLEDGDTVVTSGAMLLKGLSFGF